MKTYYIIDKSLLSEAMRHFKEYHYIDLPSGKVLIGGTHHGEAEHRAWNQLAVDAFPHLLSRKALNSSHISELGYLGVITSDSTFDIVGKLAAVHPLLGDLS